MYRQHFYLAAKCNRYAGWLAAGGGGFSVSGGAICAGQAKWWRCRMAALPDDQEFGEVWAVLGAGNWAARSNRERTSSSVICGKDSYQRPTA